MNLTNSITEAVEGTFKPHPKGFGFINTDAGTSVFVPPRTARGFFFGDRVSCTTTTDDIGRLTASSVNLLAAPRRRLAATIVKTARGIEAMPEWSPVPNISLSETGLSAKADDRVVIEVIPGDNMVQWRAQVVWNGGPLSEKNVESLLSMAEMNIPGEAEPGISAAAQKAVSDGRSRAETQVNRADMRDVPFVTIDGENTRDIDDAIHVERTEIGYRLRVAIADVAEYVLPGTVLDADASMRGTTVYFNQQTIPMLPRELSTGACSLNPNEDKTALVATMEINNDGAIVSTALTEAWIRSRYKLSYNEVTAAFDPDSTVLTDAPEWKELLTPLRDVYDVLLRARLARGATPIREGDYKIALDEMGKPLKMEHQPWHIAYGFVEECMLAANSGVAKWMDERDLPGIYRNHNGPDQTVWDERRKYFASLGLDSEEIPTPQGLAALTQSATSELDQVGVNNAVRGAMRPAQYRTDETSHFSLAYEAYTHFTSPIRRYADLSVHRVIKNALRNEPTLSREEMTLVAANCTMKDLRARLATRAETKRLKQQLALQWLHQAGSAEITGGNNAGWFIKVPSWHMDGFALHEGENRRAWSWNEELQCAEKASGEKLPVGTKMGATLKEVDLKKWRLGFEMNYTPTVTAHPGLPGA